jgi:uncharacterized protein YaaQ
MLKTGHFYLAGNRTFLFGVDIARQFHSYAMEHCRFPDDAEILSDADPKDRVQ